MAERKIPTRIDFDDSDGRVASPAAKSTKKEIEEARIKQFKIDPFSDPEKDATH